MSRPPPMQRIGGMLIWCRNSLQRAIIGNKVRPFVWVYYAWLFYWGFCAVFLGVESPYVKLEMGAAVYRLWVVLHFVGTAVVLAAMLLEDSTKNVRNKRWHSAIRLQAGGHSCMFFVLLAYEISALQVTKWATVPNVDPYSIYVVAPYIQGCALLWLQAMVFATDTDQRWKRHL